MVSDVTVVLYPHDVVTFTCWLCFPGANSSRKYNIRQMFELWFITEFKSHDFFSQLQRLVANSAFKVNNTLFLHMEPINIDYFHVFSSGAHIFANTSNHRNPSTPRESSCFATQIMLWIFSLISTPSMSNHHLKLTTCHLHPITVGIIDDS